MIQVEGSYYAHGSSKRQYARMEVSDSGQVSICVGGSDVMSSAINKQLTSQIISPRLGHTPRKIQFISGDQFETTDNDTIDQLLSATNHGKAYRLIHLLESHFPFVVLVVILVLIFFWGSVKFGVPMAARVTAEILPESVSRQLGKGTLDILDKSVFEPSSLTLKRQNQLKNAFDAYLSDFSKQEISVIFRKGGAVGANAMALPDGKIVFTDELIELSQNDYQLIAILGHEVGHLVHHHMLRRVVQDSVLAALLVLITGDMTSASSMVIAAPVLLLELSYSREFENEADNFAYNFLDLNDIDTNYFAQIMELLSDREDRTNVSEPEGVSSFLSTHPATQKRIHRFKK